MITGFIAQETGSFVPALLVAAMVALAASLSYLFIVSKQPVTYAELVSVGAAQVPKGV